MEMLQAKSRRPMRRPTMMMPRVTIAGTAPGTTRAVRSSKKKSPTPQWVNPNQAQEDEKAEVDTFTVRNSKDHCQEKFCLGLDFLADRNN